ncbi:MAG: chemotaxis protein CheA, partial [Chloroflexota bacterium]
NAEPGETSETAAVIEDAPTTVKAPEASPYEEENDQELFAIFLENMREKIDLVRTQAAELEHSADKIALLERCAENIQALQSAANYMSYEELTTIYNNWHEDIIAVQQAIEDDEDVPYDFMDGYLAEISAIFPQLEPQTNQQTTDDSKADSETQPLTTEQTDEEKLYQKLSNALDDDASRPEAAEYELLHGVFEEMISDREGSPAKKQPASDKPDAGAASSKTQPASTKKKVTGKSGAEVTAKAKENKPTATDKTNDTVIKKNVRVEAEKIDSLINQVGELVVDRAYFFQLFDDMRGLQQHFKDDIGLDQKEMKQVRAFTYRMGEAIASLSRTSNELQEGVMKIRMLPISQLFNRYPRLVHDLTRNKNKKVNLRVEGEDTELDKMVVEKLSDPLIHIIRNAVDHGLEGEQDRISAGKAEAGTLFLKAYHESNQVVVEIMDDGRGIDPELVKNKAIEKGVVSKNEADRMTPQELIRLITAAGFSTAEQITDTSGRGVGMDVVRKNIEKLNGTLEIDSRPGQGTSIRLKIPLTLAIIPAHLVRVSGNMYTIPLANIEETLRINKDETTVIEGTEVVYLRGKTLPVIHLSSLFNTRNLSDEAENLFVVVVNTGTQKIGLVVDELLGQEEVVIKPLEDYLRDKSGFSGATIIGDGSISLILDIYEIANMMANEQIRRQQERTIERKSAGAAG